MVAKTIKIRKTPVMVQKAISSLELQAKTEPPKFMPIMKKAEPPMRMVIPSQSVFLNFSINGTSGKF